MLSIVINIFIIYFIIYIYISMKSIVLLSLFILLSIINCIYFENALVSILNIYLYK